MNKSIKSFISTIIAALLCFLFQPDTVVEECIPTLSKCIELTSDNFHYLLRGDWTVITSKSRDEAPVPIDPSNRNVAILFVNSIKKAELAARLGITDPKSKSYVKNGEFMKNGKTFKISRPIPFSEILDLYVYYWSLNIKKAITSESSVESIMDESLSSILKMVQEIFKFYVKS